ncbi:MAG: polyprenyl diphosphate synthase [Acidobacteriota bacterium]
MAVSNSSNTSVPRHVAIVMDGNGRWASKRFMPRGVGHKAGVDSLISVVNACTERGIPYLTVFAFSSENWKRPEEEVSGLMSLLVVALSKHLLKLKTDGVQIRVVGDSDHVSDKVREALSNAEKATADNGKLVLTVAFNYGGRWDIVQACKKAMAEGVPPHALTEEALSRYMAMSYAPDPDLFIRTGGEVRLSNFLLWQSAYAELYFTDCLWPDFDAAELDRALNEYAQRERRFGGVNAETPAEQKAG